MKPARLTAAAALAGLLAASAASAATAETADPFAGFGRARLDRPIDIESSRLEGTRERAVFEGEVRVTQDDMVLTADKLVADLDPESGRKFQRLTALGHVRITQAGRIATGERAVLDQGSRTLVMTGDVRLVQGENILRGEVVRVFMDERRMEIDGGEGGGRVRATFLPSALRDGAPDPARPFNALDARELAALLDCPESEAALIVADRAARGPFGTPEDLGRVAGLAPETVRNASRAASQGKVAFGAAVEPAP